MAKKKTEVEVRFEADTQEFKSNIKASEKTMISLRKELKLNATELKGDAENTELLAERSEILSKEAQESQNKINNLNKMLDEAKRTFGDDSEAVRVLNNKLIDAKTQFAAIQNEIKSTDSKLNGLTGDTGNSANEFDDLADSVKKSGKEAEQSSSGGWSVLKQTLADFVSGTLDSIKEKFKEVAIEGERSLDKLKAKTFANGDAMQKYESVAKSVYKNAFGDSFSDVTEAIAGVIEITGDLDDVTLQNVTQNAMTLNDVYDMEIKESMRAVNSMVKQFGISYEEAFDIIVAGTQNGLNQNDDFLDTLNEYSVQYKNAGYSAQDMFNMLSNGAQTGTWSIDKLGDALKEYNIRMSDGTAKDYLKELGLDAEKLTAQYAKGGESAKLATQKIITALKNTDDKQKQYIAGQGIMGTMWEDLGAEAIFSLVNTQGEIDATSERMFTLADDAYDNLGSAFNGIAASIETDLLQPLSDDTSSFVWDLVPKIQDLIGGLAEAYQWGKENKNILAGLAIAIGVVAGAFGIYNGLVTIGNLLNATQTTSIGGLIVAKWSEFAANSALNASNIALAASGMAALWPILLIVAAIAAVIAIIVVCVKHWDEIKAKVTEVAGSIGDKCQELKNKITTAFSNLGEKIKAPFVSAHTKIMSVKDSIIKGFKSIPETIGNLFSGLKNKIKVPKIEVSYSNDGTLGKVAQAIGLQGFPKLSIRWNKDGAFFTDKTIVANGYAEAGDSEYALPLNSKTLDPLAAGVVNHMQSSADLSEIISSIKMLYNETYSGNMTIENKIVNAVENRLKIMLDSRELGRVVRSY